MFKELLGALGGDKKDLKYAKKLDFFEYDKDGDKITPVILVYDVDRGYNVMRDGAEYKHLGWFPGLAEAVEFAVDTARQEIGEHAVKELEDKS